MDPVERRMDVDDESTTRTTYKIKSSFLEISYESRSELIRNRYLGVTSLPVTSEVTVSGKLTKRKSTTNTSNIRYGMSFFFTNNDVVEKLVNLNISGYLFHDRHRGTEKITLFSVTDFKQNLREKRTYAKVTPWFSNFRKISNRSGKLVIQFEEICIDQGKLELEDNHKICNLQVMRQMYEDDSYKDLEFVIDGEERVMAHKCVVVARSEVFRAMLEHNMQEKNKGTVEIKDTDAKTFRAFLKYLYTGEIGDIDGLGTIAIDLVKLSDKYMVKSLKKECERHFCNNLNETNAVEALIVAHFHNFENLERIALMNVKYYISKIEPQELERLDPYPTLLRKIIKLTADDNDDASFASDTNSNSDSSYTDSSDYQE